MKLNTGPETSEEVLEYAMKMAKTNLSQLRRLTQETPDTNEQNWFAGVILAARLMKPEAVIRMLAAAALEKDPQ